MGPSAGPERRGHGYVLPGCRQDWFDDCAGPGLSVPSLVAGPGDLVGWFSAVDTEGRSLSRDSPAEGPPLHALAAFVYAGLVPMPEQPPEQAEPVPHFPGRNLRPMASSADVQASIAAWISSGVVSSASRAAARCRSLLPGPGHGPVRGGPLARLAVGRPGVPAADGRRTRRAAP
ncbi:hypothetical protein GCM10010145_58160 [Streptomyces ruber]|uniref:Uncharacterized protein n=2 Tax=Streptomyces TaxID=1883 RepID=A0A918BQG1_9ACTN|nr:hypothetical protein GCM10010145_58160 [Streptomyces ruber]